MATANAAARGVGNVTFQEGDPAGMTFDRPFDAVIGRYVLIFQPDPAAWLAAVARHARAGGIIAFHEPDGSFTRSWPPAPLYDLYRRQVIDGFGATGCDTNIAARIRPIFKGAGLRSPTLRFQAIIGGAADTGKWLEVLAGMAVSLRPAMERLGIPTAGEIETATLAADLRRDVEAHDSTILGRVEIGAWTTT
jgi:SAM-dependent methyltransferase